MQLLKAECASCHNPEKKKGGLVLTSRETLLKGGEEGPVVTPGKPDTSLLLKSLASAADPHMPPKKQLAESQIKLLRDWVKAGVKWDAKAFDEDFPMQPVQLQPLPSDYQPVFALALSPDGKQLALARGDAVVVHQIGKTNFAASKRFKAHADAVQSLVWSRDGNAVASGAFREVKLWDPASGEQQRTLTNGLVGLVTGIKFVADGKEIIVADSVAAQAGFVRRYRLEDGKLLQSWRAHADAIYGFDCSADEKQLATGSGDKLIRIWNLESGKETAQLEGHAAQVLAVAFNSNATQIASCGADHDLRIWDVQTRQKIATLGKHTASITALQWPQDGKVVYAASDAGMLLTYSNLKPHTGMESSSSGEERKLVNAGDAVLSLAITPEAKYLVAGTHSGKVQVFSKEGKLLTSLAPEPAENKTVASVNPEHRKNTGKTKSREKAELSTVDFKLTAVASLFASPSEIQLSADASSHGVLISAKLANGFEVDATSAARFSASRKAPFTVTAQGQLRALRPGKGTLVASVGKNKVEIPVVVNGGASNDKELGVAPASFVRDVLPALSKAGCSAGACHAKAEGQNGFKLSVFSYDPKGDYAEIVKDAHGRRVFPSAPEESLILKKPLTVIPHEGGLRFERGSETHQLLVRWIRQGMAYSLTNEPALERLSVFPKERRYQKKAAQRLLVQAHYSDGSVRDVTPLAAFDSNDKEIAKVDEGGLVRVGTLTGQGVIVARYMGMVADSHILVPADRLLPDEKYAALPRNNFIDDLAYDHFRQLGLFPSDLCSDAEFLRRASLDAIGVLPTPDEVRSFLADKDPNKRTKLIAHLVERPAFVDYWANKWADLLRPNPDRVGVKSVFILDQWIRESFRQNKPYDQFVREIILAEGSNHRDGPAVVYRDRREPSELTTMFSQLFLGTRMECAKCHHHPNEKWSQDDFYQFAAFFGGVKQKGGGLSPPISGGTETFFFRPGGKVKHPLTEQVMAPRAPDAPEPKVSEQEDPRAALADWLTAADNPFFAKAAVNRAWANFFGRGMVEPVDDFRVSNPCVDPNLLAALGEDFVKHGYDLKHLMRTIMQSRLYQLSSTPNEFNLADTRHFSRAYRRRLPGEVLLDAVNDVTATQDTFSAMPQGTRAMNLWSYKIESTFLDAFSRPNPSSDCPCERDRQTSVVQALHMMNSKSLQSKLSNKTGRVRQLADSTKTPEEIVTELYLATVTRPPAEEELRTAVAAFKEPKATRQTATEDVLWALINSAEFVFNH